MTLEDFFTLTEMKDGLTAPARVKELVNVMKREKDCTVKNVGDVTRQWSTVASTIAATKDKDCLDLFVQLDGLCFIDGWLKDALKIGNDTSESFVEESIFSLLCALEKLQIGYEKSMSSGIWMTVKNLLGYSSFRVQDRARALFGKWKQDGGSEAVSKDMEKIETSSTNETKGSADLAVGGHADCSVRDSSLSRENAAQEKLDEPAQDALMPSVCSNASLLENVDVQNFTSDKEKTSDPEVMKDDCSSDPAGSPIVLEPVKENLSIKKESAICQSEGALSTETCTSVVLKQCIEGMSDVFNSNGHTDTATQIENITSSLDKLDKKAMPSAVEPMSLSCDAAANAQDCMPETESPKDAIEDKSHVEDSHIGDIRVDTSEGKSRTDDASSLHHCRSMVGMGNQVWGTDIDVQLDSSDNEGKKLQKMEDSDASLSTEDSGAINRIMKHASVESENLANDSSSLKSAMDTKDSVVNNRRSDLVLDYSMIDALEVARQVAIEVEREVVDQREPSCSSSEKGSGDGTKHSSRQESVHGKDIEPIEATSKEAPTGTNLSAEASPKEDALLTTEEQGAEDENCVQNMGSSQVAEVAQESEVVGGKGLSDFDLNQEVSCEEMERLVNPISTTVSVVSASRATAATELPIAPLQFEGAHGWKGSAATSAFRPASPRRSLEVDKTLTNGASHSSSKQRQDFLDIDLNVAEVGDDKTARIPGKQVLVSCGHPFGASSVEISPTRAERFNLDLNRTSDDHDAPSAWRLEGQLFHRRDNHHSPSPSSSSSSMQPALRNFDLNDQPSFCIDSSDIQPHFGRLSSHNFNVSGGMRSDDSVISIMGTKVEVNRKDFILQTPSLQNGRILEPAMDVNLARNGSILGIGTAVPYVHPPVYGYNGLTPGPTVTFSSAMYGSAGSISYMVDPRGTPVIPQIMGSVSPSLAAHSQPSFIMNMVGSPPSANGAGPSRANFDLNSGLMIEGRNSESGNLRQFFNSGQSRSFDEHSRPNSQPSSDSGGIGKRKEPDGGWGTYPFNHKHRQPPWK